MQNIHTYNTLTCNTWFILMSARVDSKHVINVMNIAVKSRLFCINYDTDEEHFLQNPDHRNKIKLVWYKFFVPHRIYYRVGMIVYIIIILPEN